MNKRIIAVAAIAMVMAMGAVHVTFANHAWGTFHWARATSSFSVVLGDNVTANWDSYLATTASDWTASPVVDTIVQPGNSPLKNCKPVAGRIEICNSKYGSNGWLGIASVWSNGDHITQGTVKMNDTYFNTRTYNTPAWRNLVLCQEVGHTIGLDHQDEAHGNANLGTCMDYTNDPTSNQHPNQHDYDMLQTIYAHLDGTSSSTVAAVSTGSDIDTSNSKEWGKAIKHSQDGRASLYKRELGGGKSVFTHVFWALPNE